MPTASCLLAVAVLLAAPGALAAPKRPPGERMTSSVKPLFPPGGKLSQAVADLEAGKWEEAARGFTGAARPEARFMLGVALAQSGRGAEATRALSGLERRLPALADRVLYWQARALEAAGDGSGAARAYGRVPDHSLLVNESRLARARLLASEGEAGAALEALQPLLSGGASPEPVRSPSPEPIRSASKEPFRGASGEVLLLAGQLRARQGDPAGARSALLACWAGRALSGSSGACLAELERLPGEVGAAPGPEEALRRAEALLDGNRNASALAELGALVASLPPVAAAEPLSCRAATAQAKAYRRTRQHTLALETLRPVVEQCDDPQLRARALFLLAGAAAVVAPEEAVDRYRQLARDFPGHALADDALLLAADGLARLERPEEARAALEELVALSPPGDQHAEALFRLAWLDRAAGALDPAIDALERLDREHGADAYEHARALYWRSRLLLERRGEGDEAAAQAGWRGLVEGHPADYYGLLARARLGELGVAVPWPRLAGVGRPGPSYAVGPLATDRHFRAGVRLLRMGMARTAAAELFAADRREAEEEQVLLVAELLDRAGDHRSAHNLVRSSARAVLRRPPEGAALRAWRVAYPRAFEEEVERWAAPAGVEPALLLALMREESGLDPAVVSWAGAVGLTQLMPATARGEARRLGLGRLDVADLVNPPVSIRIGASYLGGLLRRYQGSEVLALAAYNAGDVPVKRWLEARGDLPLDAFVEEIPVQETRGYVKRVLRSYAAYRWLYPARGEPQPLGQALPRLASR